MFRPMRRILTGILLVAVGSVLPGLGAKSPAAEGDPKEVGKDASSRQAELQAMLKVTDGDLWETYRYEVKGAGAEGTGRRLKLASEKTGTLWKETR
jgi:hypothetical protein